MANKTTAKKPRKSKGKRHAVHANAFNNIADRLREHAKNELVDTNSPSALLLIIADVFKSEGQRVQKVVR